ncbi:hypothetical protein niasHT_011395 [Heterodera trifolii]|uniref:Uncharacterized protein n=1 Tax=Heterodera trifolii TaxID=157864 RepID=A0ABD2LIF5_9BILA
MTRLSLLAFLLLIFVHLAFVPLLGGQWSVLAHNASPGTETKSSQKCLEIPQNFTLCHGMQYTSMRLPNLLEHENIDEAIQQGSAWVSLLRLHCHQHTKLFLCSLFAPICLPQLDRPIRPCQSLCKAVEQGCAERMAKYGFPWPSMLNCSQFPVDHDMCIKPPPMAQATEKTTEKRIQSNCKACSQVATFENLMDNFCRSSVVLKVRLRPLNASHVEIFRRMRVFKDSAGGVRNRSSAVASGDRPTQVIRLAEIGERRCQCRQWDTNKRNQQLPGNFLLMASEERRNGAEFQAAKLIVPWKQEKAFKTAIRRFKRVNCNTLGREIRESVLSQMFRKS